MWRDDQAAAFLTIAPLKPGHTLVVPIEEVEHWVDLDPGLLAHLTRVSQIIGKVESRMRGNAHVRFGGRAEETHAPKSTHRASVRPDHTHAALLIAEGAHPVGVGW